MIAYFNKETGKVVASFPEAFEPVNVQIEVKEDGKLVQKADDLDYTFLLGEEARDFEDPRKPDMDIHKATVELDSDGQASTLIFNGEATPTIPKEYMESVVATILELELT
jgi:hypothetical protein